MLIISVPINLSDIPIYQQIYEQIKEEILSGKIGSGEVLPSIRQLSRDLKVSVITTTRAYTDLENDGYIMIVQGKGCFVKELNQIANIGRRSESFRYSKSSLSRYTLYSGEKYIWF